MNQEFVQYQEIVGTFSQEMISQCDTISMQRMPSKKSKQKYLPGMEPIEKALETFAFYAMAINDVAY